MEAMEMLWTYMQEDMKADRIKREIENSPTRQQAEKMRDFIMEQKKKYDQIQEQVAIYADRKDALHDALGRAQDQLDALLRRFQDNPPMDEEAAQDMIAEVERCQRTLTGYEEELVRMKKEASAFIARCDKIRQETAKARKKFNDLKEQYVQESAEKKTRHAEARKKADAKAEGIPEQLMSVYSAVKRHITPPMARLEGSQCSGCNTSLPVAILRRIETGSEIVECESCGRILIK